MQTFGETPMAAEAGPDWRNKVVHARLDVGSAALMGSDAPPKYYLKPQGLTVSIGVETPEEAERIFKALAEGGTVQMPIQKTFWSARFGSLVDRFGIPWMVNCNQPA